MASPNLEAIELFGKRSLFLVNFSSNSWSGAGLDSQLGSVRYWSELSKVGSLPDIISFAADKFHAESKKLT